MALPAPYLGLEYARALVEAAGPPHRVLVTRPYKRCLGGGPLRVVGERLTEDGAVWVLAYSRYSPLPPSS